VLKTGDLVILESTSPVGATEQMAEWLAEKRPDLTFPQTHGEDSDIRIAHCPERVLPGQVLRELVQNDRIIGGMTPKCSRHAIELYRTFVDGDCVVTDARTAELCKLTENSFRDVNIAFANELSLICERLGVNVWELIHLANKHPRVNVLQPGPGVGGHCIAVDPWFIVSSTPDTARLIHTAREVNDGKPRWVVKHVFDALEEIVATGILEEDVVIACYGLTFKPDIDDLRESPALQIATAIAERFQGKLKIIEPNVHALPAALPNAVHVNEEPVDAHLHVILVGHRSFRTMPQPNGRVLDFCGAVENRLKRSY
jgi:UDP-N-acetyl-D-mannosaminuronic acid dehydrogenase